MLKPHKEAYQLAQKDPRHIQAYLDLHEDSLPAYVSGLVHAPDSETFARHLRQELGSDPYDLIGIVLLAGKHRDPHIHMGAAIPASAFGTHKALPIFFKDLAFKKGEEEEFLCKVEDHEFIHRYDQFYGIDLWETLRLDHNSAKWTKPGTLENVGEIRALAHHIPALVEKGLESTDSYVRCVSHAASIILELSAPQNGSRYDYEVRDFHKEYFMERVPDFMDRAQNLIDTGRVPDKSNNNNNSDR